MAAHEHEQRKSFRLPVREELQDAELKAGKVRMRVRLFNESAGGFAVISEQLLPFKQGDLLELRTANGCYEVRVAHMARPALGDPTQHGGKRPSYQLGLERVGETSEPTQDDVPRAGWWTVLPQHWLNPFRSSGGETVTLLLALALIPTALALFAWCYQLPLLNWLQRSDRTESADSSDEETIDLLAPPRAAASQPGDGKSPARPAPSLASMRRLVRRLPDASPLAVPAVAEHLSLDSSQQWEIRRLVEATRKALANIDQEMAQASPAAREQSRRSIQETARSKALQVLSNRQRERWAALTDENQPLP